MSHELTITPSNPLVIDGDSLSNIDIGLTHSGISDVSISLAPDVDIKTRIGQEVYIHNDGNLIFRGYLQTIDESVGSDSVGLTIRCVDIFKDLKRTNITRNPTNKLAAKEIQDIWDTETSFNATVNFPSAEETVTLYNVQAIDTTSEFESVVDIDDTTPARINNGEIELLQTCFHKDSISFFDSSGGAFIASDSDATDGDAIELTAAGEWVEYEYTTEYTIPAIENVTRAQIAARTVGAGTDPLDITVSIDGSGQGTTAPPTTDYGWSNLSIEQGELSPGTYIIRVEASGNGTDSVFIDRAALADVRYSYTFGDTLTNGQLDGPEFYPPDLTPEFEFELGATPWAITSADVVSAWSDTSESQRMQVSIGVSGNWRPDDGTEDNTDTLTDVTFGEIGSGIKLRVRLSGYPYGSNAQNDTPRFGYNGQSIDAYTLVIDGDDRPVINDRELQGSVLDVLQNVHNSADMRFWADGYSENSKPVVSARRGDVVRTPPDYSIKTESKKRDLEDFWNKVLVIGARIDGERITFEDSDQSSINDLGFEEQQVFDRPDIKNASDLESFAKQKLKEGVRENERVGSVEFGPGIAIPAGPNYEIEWSDGTVTEPASEEITYTLSNDTFTGTIEFDLSRLLISSTQSDNSREIGFTKGGF